MNGRHQHFISIPTRSHNDLSPIVDELCDIIEGPRGYMHQNPCATPHPSREMVIGLVEDLRGALFPGYFGSMDVITCENMRYHVGAVLNHVRPLLHEQIRRGLCFGCNEKDGDHPECNIEALNITNTFFERLPEIRRRLATDIQAAYDGDPAATNPAEVIFCYPGLLAITSQRIAHELHILGTPLLPRIITEHAHSITGIDIHPGATIGDGFFIDHGTGTVIGETAEIGDRVTLYQGVTLGAKSFPLDENGNPIKGIPRHPVVESDVVIYANATILGRITIGHDSMIGGNVWVTHDVAPYSKVTMKSLSEERQPQPA